MPRRGGPSRGYRLCREKKIKCDETAPQCLQCTSSGLQCPGPITGALINDMTPKFTPTVADSASRSTRKVPEILPRTVNQVSATTGRAEGSAPAVRENATSTRQKQLVCSPGRGTPSQMLVDKGVIPSVQPPERVGATLDPFQTLPVQLRGVSAQSVFHYCANGMGSFLVPFGGLDPMRDLWLPWVLSDQLIFASSLFRAAVHLSALNFTADTESVRWRGVTLSLLNARLASPTQPVNDITVASVILLAHQSIINGDPDETKVHLEGLEKMLFWRGTYAPMPQVQEILFWVDLVGSAFTHQPMRHYTAKPEIRLPCLPVGLTPGTTLSCLCVGFQPLLLNPHFDALIDPLHELRCLAIAFHFSGGTANLKISTFSQLCSRNKRWCQALLNTTESHTFDLCLIATMLFLDLILLSDTTDTVCLSAILQSTLKLMRLEDFAELDKKLTLWILYVGCAAARGTNLASWYYGHFANTLAALDILELKDAKHVLVEFLWVAGPCDVYLEEIWKAGDIACSLFAFDGE